MFSVAMNGNSASKFFSITFHRFGGCKYSENVPNILTTEYSLFQTFCEMVVISCLLFIEITIVQQEFSVCLFVLHHIFREFENSGCNVGLDLLL